MLTFYRLSFIRRTYYAEQGRKKKVKQNNIKEEEEGRDLDIWTIVELKVEYYKYPLPRYVLSFI